MAATLTGSEKQITWATEIRTNFVVHSQTLAQRVRDNQLTWVDARVRPHFAALIERISGNFVAQTASAKAWIDHKDLGTASGVEAFFVARLKKDAEAQALMQARR